MWCLNSAILLDEAYKENIRKCISYAMENPLFEENVSGKKKKKKKVSSIRYFMRKSKAEVMKKAMEKEAQNIESNPEHGKEYFCQIKEEMDEFEREKCEGAKVRSRAQHAVEGERSKVFF